VKCRKIISCANNYLCVLVFRNCSLFYFRDELLRPYSAMLSPWWCSVLVTGPKGCEFEPGQDDGFLRAIKIRSTPSSRMGSKAGKSHVVRFYGM
jgi:hypothetical protein